MSDQNPLGTQSVPSDDFFDDDEVLQASPGAPSYEPQRDKPGFFSRLSRYNPFASQSSRTARLPQPSLQGDTSTMQDADYTVTAAPAVPSRLNTANMTQEQLRTRRTNLIESSKFGRPFHEAFMLRLLKFWLVLGPIAFVALTTSEVAYILTSLVPKGDTADYVITGGALFIDLAMMFVTFGVAIKRRDLAEKREVNGSVSKREEAEVWFGTALWITFAAINIISQTAFLLHIIALSHDSSATILYVFIGARVAGFILGDASTAFFLAKVDNSPLKQVARSEREKGKIYKDVAEAEGERAIIEAESEAKIMLIQIEVAGKQEEAKFLADLKRQMFTDILTRRPQTPEVEGPNKSRLRRLD